MSERVVLEYDLDVGGKRVPGLIWPGGEVQQKFSKDAHVVACLDDDGEIAGIGERNGVLVFAPTYWPAFFAYQGREHPEVESLLLAALKGPA